MLSFTYLKIQIYYSNINSSLKIHKYLEFWWKFTFFCWLTSSDLILEISRRPFSLSSLNFLLSLLSPSSSPSFSSLNASFSISNSFLARLKSYALLTPIKLKELNVCMGKFSGSKIFFQGYKWLEQWTINWCKICNCLGKIWLTNWFVGLFVCLRAWNFRSWKEIEVAGFVVFSQ